MLRQYIRSFYKSTALVDCSIALQHAGGGVATPFDSGDFLYIAQTLPFNNFFLKFQTLNDSALTLKLEYHDGTTWREVVDLLDGTKGMTQNGLIQFSPNRLYGWQVIDDPTMHTPTISELSTLYAYDLYWLRISVTAGTVTDGLTIERLAYAFCMTEDLRKHEPEIDSYLRPWGGSDKEDWYEQIFTASEDIINQLKQQNLIFHPGQILRMDDVSLATQKQTIVNIYTVLGPAFDERRKIRNKEIDSALSIQRFTIDRNRNALVESSEMAASTGGLVR